MDKITHIQKYIKAGLSVIPTNLNDKKPTRKWKQYQSQLPEITDIPVFFKNDEVPAVVCGAVSGGLEIIDIDNHFGDATQIFLEFKELINNTDPELYEKLTIETTQSHGFHIAYRSNLTAGNQKLARRRKSDTAVDTIIETRGEGGYALIHPSPGYDMIQGNFAAIQHITDEQRNIIIEIARSFNEFFEEDHQHITTVYADEATKPGSAFNEKGDIQQTLKQAGWTFVGYSGDKEHWRRPGKEKGISATFNYVKDKFYVFSSNAYPFDSCRAYDKFAVETILKFNGDFKECAKDLLKRGFGALPPASMPGKKSGAQKSNTTINPEGKIITKGIPGVTYNINDPEGSGPEEIFEKLALPEECIFWYEIPKTTPKKSKPALALNKSKLINFLEYHGIFKYWIDKNLSVYIRIQENIITEETTETIVDLLKILVFDLPEQIAFNNTNLDLWEFLLQKINVIKSKDFLETLTAKKLNFIKDTQDAAYFFFENCCIKVTKNEANMINYKETPGYIWKDQIVNHKLKLLPKEIASDTGSCQFGQFLEKICSPKDKDFPLDRTKRYIDKKRLASLCSAIGYMLHTYKNPSLTKAIIFCEEKIATDDESNGRTGKGLTSYAIAKLRKRVLYNGKQINFDNQFMFQKVSLDTQFICFDDITKRFDFEALFSILTEGLTIERKGLNAIDLSYDDSPKILILTNNVLSNDSDSHRARKFEIEFSDYFSADYTPVDEFKGNFFEKGWQPESEEWDKFYSFMIYCTMFFLDKGLFEYATVNLEERKLLAKLPEEFIDFAADELENLNNGDRIYKNELYDRFTGKYKIYAPNGKYATTQKTTTRWFATFLKFKSIEYIEGANTQRDDKRKFWLHKKFEENLNKNIIPEQTNDRIF
jgi:hypothetical protein